MKLNIKLKKITVFHVVGLFLPLFGWMSLSVQAQSPEKDALLDPKKEQPESTELLINLGYHSQPIQTVTGSIATTSGAELAKSPVADLSQTLTGRLAGLITMETNGELSRGTVSSYIRGISTINGQEPLYILDGVICSVESINYITPEEIESVTVLKDVSLTALYGIQGANGAIVIVTKRGTNQNLKVTVTFDKSFQQMTRIPYPVSAYEYALLRNQAWKNDGSVGAQPFSQMQIDGYVSSSDRDLYPDNNYYDMMFKPHTWMERAGIGAVAGNEKIKMYTNVNFMHQGGQFITDQSTFKAGSVTYDSKAGNNYRFNYRTNLDFKFNNVLDGFIRLNGNVTKESTGGSPNEAIYAGLFHLPPTMYGPHTPMHSNPSNFSEILGGEIITTSYEDNPAYGMLNKSGFGRYTGTEIMAQTGLDLKMNFLTEGLRLGGWFAYQTNSSGNLIASQSYERWVRSNDLSTLEFNQIGAGTWSNTPLRYGKSSLFSYRLNTDVHLNYSRYFDKHWVLGMAYMHYQNNVSGGLEGDYVFPYNRVSSGVTATWGYDNKYFLKGDVGYSGSDQFGRSKRFMLTPALSAAWVLSREEILSNRKWFTELKLRASIGQTANDQLGEARFRYTDKFTNGGSRYIENLNYMITEHYRGNPNLEPEKTLNMNYGIDLVIAENISLTVDYFMNHTNNMLINTIGAIPSFSGLTTDIYPLINEGKIKNNGIDVNIRYFKDINRNLSIFVNTNFLYAKNTVTYCDETPMGEGYEYQYRKEGYSYGQQFGYLVDYSNGSGYFTSQAELDEVSYAFGTPRLGDFKYKNLNGDKTSDGKDIIDEKDIAPTGYSIIPRINYGVSFGGRYKRIELSCLVQGTGISSRQYHDVIGIDESPYGSIYSDIHMHAWTSERAEAGERITFPALSQQKSVSKQPNDFFTMNTSYVRVKNLELAYSLPVSVLRWLKAEQMRMVFNVQNLFTWDFMKTNNIDPEIASLDQFQNYRVFNIGVKLTF
jgi:TonB-linked SusC/RagA family outer membrane protein